ncbi:MAG: cyclic pyranopterin monophosphate synthase MoaC [Candidatus Planktophila sp.]|jgi:cyclic pyranopterin phosphate synthase
MSEKKLTHLDADGQSHMVDVSNREITVRTAQARGHVKLSSEVLTMLRDKTVPKGDVLAIARIAGIMGAKRTPELIPLCHPIALHSVTLECEIDGSGVAIVANVKTADRTGVEMEALTAVSVAALTVIDMVKAVDPSASISFVHVDSKDGGRNGSWKRP